MPISMFSIGFSKNLWYNMFRCTDSWRGVGWGGGIIRKFSLHWFGLHVFLHKNCIIINLIVQNDKADAIERVGRKILRN